MVVKVKSRQEGCSPLDWHTDHIIIILILHLSVCESVCDVRAGGLGKPS